MEHRQGAAKGDWITNLGVGGDTVRKIIARVENEIQARTGPHGGELGFVFAGGANDAMRIGDQFLSSPEQFRKDLVELLLLAKKYSSRMLFVGFTAMRPPGELPGFFDTGRVKRFDAVLRDVTAEYNVGLVPLLEEMEPRWKGLLSFDGVHPNDAGHRFIYRQVRAALAPWIPVSR